MEGFVSIDMGASAVAVDAVTSAPLAQGAASATVQPRGTPAPSDQAVEAFRAAMARPLAENAEIEAAFDTAVKSFTAAMAAVDSVPVSAPAATPVPAQPTAAPVPEQPAVPACAPVAASVPEKPAVPVSAPVASPVSGQPTVAVSEQPAVSTSAPATAPVLNQPTVPTSAPAAPQVSGVPVNTVDAPVIADGVSVVPQKPEELTTQPPNHLTTKPVSVVDAPARPDVVQQTAAVHTDAAAFVPPTPEAVKVASAVETSGTTVTVASAVAPDVPVVPVAPAVNAESTVPATVLPDGAVVAATIPEAMANVPGETTVPAAPVVKEALSALGPVTQGVAVSESAKPVSESAKPVAVPSANEPVKTDVVVPVATEETVSAEAQPVRVESGKPQPAVRAQNVEDEPEVRAENIVAAGIAPRVQETPSVAQMDPSGVQSVEAVSARTIEVADRVTKAMSASEVLIQAAEAVADAILVSPGLLRGEGEIRVQLKPDVLDGTEIRIGVTGRQMDVSFMPSNADMSALIEQCRPQLEQHLAARIHRFTVNVSVDKKSRIRDE